MFWVLAFGFASFSLISVQKTMDSPYRSMRLLDINPAIPQSAYQKAARGEIATGLQEVKGYRAKIGWGVAIFDIPIKHLYASINEEENHLDYTAVSFGKVVHGTPCSDGREVLMMLPLPIVSDRWWVTNQFTNPKIRRVSKNQAAELVWKQINNWSVPQKYTTQLQGMVQIPFTQGSWFLIALDDKHTLAEYHSWVDPGGSIPAGPASQFATGSIEDTFVQMERFAKQQSASSCDSMWSMD
tara:strand:- start:164 stop:886 length:723 start_codon:yes stop_codon:yes gene_type:complete